MKPTTPALQKRFHAAAARITGAEPRAMFGQFGAMVGDRMFAGTFEDRLVLRLPEAERALFMRAFGGRPFEPMPGRPMKEYVAAPADVIRDEATLLAWMKRAAAYVRTLPPKAGKGAKRAGAAQAGGGASKRTAARAAGATGAKRAAAKPKRAASASGARRAAAKPKSGAGGKAASTRARTAPATGRAARTRAAKAGARPRRTAR